MQPTFTDAAHLTHGDCAGGSVRAAGATTIRVTKDLLTYGPCAADPAQHVALRLAHWGLSDDKAADFALAPTVTSWPTTQPIVLWATRAWSDQLWLWHTLDQLARADIDRARLFWAAPQLPHLLISVGGARPAQLTDALAHAQPISPALVDEARALWQKFAAPSPLAFDETRRAGSTTLPDLPAIAEPHGDWFPRRLDGTLRLSELDELLLSDLDDEWGKPRVSGAAFDRLLYPYGDTLILTRLHQWAAHGAVEHAPREGEGWAAHAFRLTLLGRRLRDEGLTTVADAPAIYVGGCRIHDAAQPFVRVTDAGGWLLTAGQ
jgi:hypothetical protein